MEMNERQTRLLAESDVATLRQYRTWKTMRVSELTAFLRRLNPDLTHWFNEIDEHGDFHEAMAYDDAYERHVRAK